MERFVLSTEKCYLQCINLDCKCTYDISDVLVKCSKCGDLLDVMYNWNGHEMPRNLQFFQKKWQNRNNLLDFSGVWRFRELLPFCDEKYIATIGEGQTILQCNDGVASYVGSSAGKVHLQYEGLNPSGSFKDNGMAGAFSHARMVGAKHAICASTGNTSAALALYAHSCGMEGTVFIGSGKIAYGKLSQALDYGARTIQIKGDFDDCMRQVQLVAKEMDLYLVNSLNPFRLEGQKTIMYRILEGLNWQVPDWIVVPGGNLGNSSAFGKAFAELKELGLINKIPRLAIINATGANTLFELYEKLSIRYNGGNVDTEAIDSYYAQLDKAGFKPKTLASAIEISRPVNLKKCLRALEICNGVVREVSDDDILDARAIVARWGLGCEPASAASVAGLKLLRSENIIGPDETVACVLTGHELKDPTATVNYHIERNGRFSNKPVEVENDIDEIIRELKK
ncbi:MAG: threonine synthase [Phycisphaerae bacterium]|nr:threonine synthase [Phycisphaerae bacterium]